MFLLFSLGDLFIVFDCLIATVVIDTPCCNFALMYYVTILEVIIIHQSFCLVVLVLESECVRVVCSQTNVHTATYDLQYTRSSTK